MNEQKYRVRGCHGTAAQNPQIDIRGHANFQLGGMLDGESLGGW